jgi:hypothetical protein
LERAGGVSSGPLSFGRRVTESVLWRIHVSVRPGSVREFA